jgi:hypothetical protein
MANAKGEIIKPSFALLKVASASGAGCIPMHGDMTGSNLHITAALTSSFPEIVYSRSLSGERTE